MEKQDVCPARDSNCSDEQGDAAADDEDDEATAAAQQPQPELHIRADRTTPYEEVAKAMSEAARQGLSKIGFVTDPAVVNSPS